MRNAIDIIILAAGFGTRLYPLTSNLPKALLKIGQKTILDRIMDRVILIDSRYRIFIVTNSRFYSQIEKWATTFINSSDRDDEIILVDDGKFFNKERMGPIGDINLVLEKYHIANDLMIIASDNIIEFDLNQLIMLQDKKGSSVFAAYDFHETSAVKKKFGVVRLDSDNKLLSFAEKPDNPESSIAATGIYLIKNEDIQHIRMLHTRPHAGELNLGDMIVEILSQNVTVHCLLVPQWFDIGSLDDLRKANDEFAAK